MLVQYAFPYLPDCEALGLKTDEVAVRASCWSQARLQVDGWCKTLY